MPRLLIPPNEMIPGRRCRAYRATAHLQTLAASSCRSFTDQQLLSLRRRVSPPLLRASRSVPVTLAKAPPPAPRHPLCRRIRLPPSPLAVCQCAVLSRACHDNPCDLLVSERNKRRKRRRLRKLYDSRFLELKGLGSSLQRVSNGSGPPEFLSILFTRGKF